MKTLDFYSVMQKILISLMSVFFIASLSIVVAQEANDENKLDDKVKVDCTTKIECTQTCTYTCCGCCICNGYATNGFNVINVGDDNTALMMGGAMLWQVSKRIYIGAAAYTTPIKFNLSDPEAQNLKFSTSYAGFQTAYKVLDSEAATVTVPVLFGAGMESYYENVPKPDNINRTVNNKIGSSYYLLIEPGIDVTFKLNKYFGISVGATYRNPVAVVHGSLFKRKVIRFAAPPVNVENAISGFGTTFGIKYGML
ncbi:MAG: hypothetical protein IIA45_00940 [Bacteroidetes bacterium]|nr:hypothetical protein [Bacteroidota bacterium]